MSDNARIPLCVDLDGTLLKTDVAHESLWDAVRRSPGNLLHLLPIMMKGRAALRSRVLEMGGPDPSILPMRTEVLRFLRAERDRGRELILVTRTSGEIARSIADRLGIFADVIIANSTENHQPPKNADDLSEHFGEQGFDYISATESDPTICQQARKVWVAGPVPSLSQRSQSGDRIPEWVSRGPLDLLYQMLRIPSWIKNLLVFIPLLTAHAYLRSDAWIALIVAFMALCLCTSGTYLLNDLFDLASDRRSPTKRRRPLAAGDFPIIQAMILSAILIGVGLIFGAAISLWAFALLLLFVTLGVSYTFHLKHYLLMDVFALTGLYFIRIWIGSAVAGIPMSRWLIGFSFFLFLSLSIAKRCAELSNVRSNGSRRMESRSYRVTDRDVMSILGIASGFVSVGIFALYVYSAESLAIYRSPGALWLVCPLLLYWISRIWVLVYRTELAEDPVLFALRDRSSHVIALFILSAIILATPF